MQLTHCIPLPPLAPSPPQQKKISTSIKISECISRFWTLKMYSYQKTTVICYVIVNFLEQSLMFSMFRKKTHTSAPFRFYKCHIENMMLASYIYQPMKRQHLCWRWDIQSCWRPDVILRAETLNLGSTTYLYILQVCFVWH